MALIQTLVPQELKSDATHLPSECTISVVQQPEGRYLQIDSYGSKTRKIVGKKSQSLRFAPSAIAELKAFLADNDL